MTFAVRFTGAMVVACAFATDPLSAQRAERNAPATYAITNARLVPVSGPVIDKGTIVIRDGIITAIGASVSVPADARPIDGTGLSVYPGLIDAYTSLGVPTTSSQGGGTGRGGGGGGGASNQTARVAAPNSNYPPGLQPETSVLDDLRPDPESFNGPYTAGITAVLTGSPNGIFQGQSALINLTGNDATAMVVKAGVAQNIGFTPLRAGGYPNSLLGVFSALRQMLLDAQHYRDEKAAYDKNPRGMRRPEFDASLEALQPVISRQQPVIMEASTQREIERALDLAKEFNLRAIIAGGGEAYLVADRLKAENVPVLLTANFPRRTTQPSADADPEPLRVLRERADAPKGAGRLSKGGVRFAFESGGMSNWPDFLGNVQRATAEGLATDQALRALTLWPAEILGVGDRLGSLEVGKIANLTITRGDLFDPAVRVTQLFIDGRPVTPRNDQLAGGSGRGGRAGAGMATGSWTVTVALEGGEHPITVALRQEGTRLVGNIQGALGTADISNGSIGSDGEFRFTVSVTLKEGTEEASFTGNVDGNAVRGRVTIVGHNPGTFSGTRPGSGGGAF